MKAKTYRIAGEQAEAASTRVIEYITGNQELVTEAQVINASIKKGLENLTDEEIKRFIESSS